jgi:hypothetical protein
MEELDPKRAGYYQGLIEVLQWITKQGRINVLIAVALMFLITRLPQGGDS